LLVAIISVVLVACGGSDPTAVPAAAVPATAVPAAAVPATAVPAAADATAEPVAASSALEEYAARFAGGPGAIYTGDLNALVGPAPSVAEGDADGNVTLGALKNHRFVYESDHYKSLIEKARLTDPTPLTSVGESITIQNTCVNRALTFCRILESFWAPNLEERTNGQLIMQSSSFPEIGIAGPDSLRLVEDGVLDLASILGVYIAGEVPALEIQSLYGLFNSREDQYNATNASASDVEKIVVDASNGQVKLINYNWHSGDDIYLFTNKPLDSIENIKDLKTRSFGTAIGDWINGMGGNAQFMAFTEVYTALERGVIDAGVTGGGAAHGQRWYEVTKYINGPLTSWPTSLNMMNIDVWDKLPEDLQKILIEEGAKSELEALRTGSIQNELGLQKNIDAGMTFIKYPPEVVALSEKTIIENVVPKWVERVGGPDQDIVRVFNEKIGTIVGIEVQPDGTAIRTK
jgi:TRAP-type C4-dicarboxylate transport system substrate-binding protein